MASGMRSSRRCRSSIRRKRWQKLDRSQQPQIAAQRNTVYTERGFRSPRNAALSACSVQFGTALLDDLRPLLEVRQQKLSEVFRRASDRLRTISKNTLACIRSIQNVD